jgi:N,N'-diacetyllegionaminate synthase
MGCFMSIRVIAEAGENHVGDIERARQMVRVAAKSGADFVKFQSFSTDDLAPTVDSDVRAWVQRVQLSVDDHHVLHTEAKQAGIVFLSTAVNVRWAKILREMDCSAVKLASLSLTNEALLSFVGEQFDEVFISTGMGNIKEIMRAIQLLGPKPRVTILHCVSEYPLPDSHASLRSIRFLKERFNLPTGYSDHTIGTVACIAAAALGAELIEKHFTLDKTLEGTDHILSADAAELAAICYGSRRVSAMLGEPDKRPSTHEVTNRDAARGLFVEGK